MKVVKRIENFFELRKAYKDLSLLNDASLKDIGVSRSEIRSRVYSA
ncbi:DUF1127 domain-containing protein [Rhizobium tubonense]|uniref:YjiS-like domain-containing protein n=1 Tax=Rhizobium tubonense TaxID=484088 RepID=A0A2W4DYE7_9HYPH|nr:DUF1127 domain-containing protein [Rhizobium tubonense]PZM08836.1 hypothetical protein CPY51_28135 [Rhizobium tubonense]